MQLSPNFSYEEMTATSIRGIDNNPSGTELANLKVTASKMEEVRALLGYPINVNSGYRSPGVNKAVGSTAKNSEHMQGKAVDFICPKYGNPRQIVEKIKSSNISFNQLILEFDSWVHISFSPGTDKKQVLIIDNKGTRNYS